MLMSTVSLYAIQFFGTVAPPPGVAAYNAGGTFGMIQFVSNIIRLIAIIAGLFSLFNLVFAGFTYVTAANNVKAVETAWQSILMSLVGMAIIVGSFIITAIFSYIIFGDATFILNPTITGVSAPGK